MLFKTNKIEIQQNGKVIWLEKEYYGTLNEYRKQIEKGDIYMMNDTILLWTFLIKIFKSIENIIQIFYLNCEDGYIKKIINN